MSKTKAQLETENKELKLMVADIKESYEHELRRLHRAISQMGLDLKALEVDSRPERTVYASPQSREALDRAQAEWERNVTEPNYGGDWQRINTYIKSSEGIGVELGG